MNIVVVAAGLRTCVQVVCARAADAGGHGVVRGRRRLLMSCSAEETGWPLGKCLGFLLIKSKILVSD